MVIEHRSTRPASVAVLADTDSRWKWAVQLGRRINPDAALAGYQLHLTESPSERQLVEAGIRPGAVRRVDPAGLVAALADSQPDVLIVSLAASGVQAILHLVAAADLPHRPLVVTGYVGVVYEKVVEGLLMRAGADIVAANSPADRERFRQVFESVGADPDTVVLSQLPFLDRPKPRPAGRFTLTFAPQPSVPGPYPQRRYLVERLVDHAVAHPEREVVLKLRALPGERVTHHEAHPYLELVRAYRGPLPPNFSVVSGDMGEMLNRTDLLVTVSSTAAVEAMHRGVPTAVLTDFGIRESLGNAYYLGSGCLVSFDELDAGARPVADPAWARANGLGDDLDELPARVAEMLGAGGRAELRPFYTMANAPALLPGVLARYGIADDSGSDSPAKGALRSAVQRSALRLYRHGADVVAPALRKLATL